MNTKKKTNRKATLLLVTLLAICMWLLAPRAGEAFGGNGEEWLVTPNCDQAMCPAVDQTCKELCYLGEMTGTFRCFTV